MIPFVTHSQNEPVTDSIEYYQKQASEISRRFQDSIRQSPEYLHAQERLSYLRSKSNDHVAFAMYVELVKSDYDELNKSIAADGFPPLDNVGARFGLGYSYKWDRNMVDLFVAAFGMDTKSKKGDEKVSSSFSSYLQLDYGYDLLNFRSINFFPFVGASFRVSKISFSKAEQLNPNFTNITNIVQSDIFARASSTRIGYQAGLGINFLFHEKGQNGGAMFFLKAYTTGPFWKHSYKVESVKYDPGIRHGEFVVSAGIKMFGK